MADELTEIQPLNFIPNKKLRDKTVELVRTSNPDEITHLCSSLSKTRINNTKTIIKWFDKAMNTSRLLSVFEKSIAISSFMTLISGISMAALGYYFGEYIMDVFPRNKWGAAVLGSIAGVAIYNVYDSFHAYRLLDLYKKLKKESKNESKDEKHTPTKS